MKFLVLRAEPIPWNCEVFLWEQAFNFVPAGDSETEQIGLRMGTTWVCVCVEREKCQGSTEPLPHRNVSSTKTPLDAQIKASVWPIMISCLPQLIVEEELKDSNQCLN